MGSDGQTLPQRGALFITGITGFVGMEVLARWLERSDRKIYALVRAKDDEGAAERLRAVLATSFGNPNAHRGRVVALPGDIQQDCLGLDSARLDEIAAVVTGVIHSAASVSFALGVEESRAINVDGTRRMLDFADRCQARGGLERFTYVSTAYVAGEHAGPFTEDDYDVGQKFRNPYERSKWESEGNVRRAAERLPVQVIRPSIVVGEQASGWTAAFNVMYGPIRAFSTGAYKVAPMNMGAPIDIVPIDYVADGIFELTCHGPERTFHLVAADKASTIGRLAKLSSEHFNRPLPWVVPGGVYKAVYPLMHSIAKGKQRVALEHTQVFMPYLSMKVRFKSDITRARLEPAGVTLERVDEYFPRLLDFAEAAEWGKRPLPHPRSTWRWSEPLPEPDGGAPASAAGLL
jgi:thioester reductase-like protein